MPKQSRTVSRAPANLVVTYHYVRPVDSDGAVGVTPEEFRAHLRLIKTMYSPVTAEEFVAFHRERTGLALVTFDDALRDQFDHAFPILEDEGVPAVYYAPMRPYAPETDRWCTQHLLHALAHELGWSELERRLEPHLEPHTAGRVIDRSEVDRLYHYETPHKRRLKYIIAFVLDHRTAGECLRRVNGAIGLRPEDWYMSAEELREVQNAGHALGGHGFDHIPFNTLTPKQQAGEMHRAQALMTRLFGAMGRTLAYPFGRFTAETPAIAQACGYTHCFSTEDRVDAKFLRSTLGVERVACAPAA